MYDSYTQEQNDALRQSINNTINKSFSPQKIADVKFTIPSSDDLYRGDYCGAVYAKCTQFSKIRNQIDPELGCYWIKASTNEPCIVKSHNFTIYTRRQYKFYGVRPMISAEEAQKIKHILRKVGEMALGNIYELGEFPQDKCDEYIDVSKLRPTGKIYHTGYDGSVKIKSSEYILNKTKYAVYNNNYYVVKPIRWIEGKDGQLLADNILLSSDWGNGNGENPDIILNGLNTYFAKEIIPQGNNMQNSNIYPRIVNEREIGDGITVSDLSLYPDDELPDVNGENESWFQPDLESQTQSSGGGLSNKKQSLTTSGKSSEDTYDEEIDEVVAEFDKSQKSKGQTTMNNNSKTSVVVVDETPMSINEQIEFYVRNGMSFMLHGPSGIGKTARVEQVDPDLTAVPLWNGVLPEDIVGKVRYPSGQEVAATEENLTNGVWVEPDWYVELKRKCAAEPDKMHVLFIDEVTNARPTTQSLIFHLTLKKSITPSKGKLPENSVVILAGNNRNESEAAYNMPEPLFRRMSGHIYLEPDVREWMIWGSESSYKHPNDKNRTNIHPLVTSFVGTYGDDVFYSEYKEDESKYALDPRGWEQVSDIIYNNHGIIRKELLVAKMGNELASNFLAFAKIPQLSAEDIVNHNYDRRSIPATQDAKLALTLNLRHADNKQQKEVRRFIVDNLGKEYGSVFDAAKRSSELAAENKGIAFKLGGWGRNG
ncbi:MAG: hypothetical protein IJ532_00090 [Alphaproteobacteria bacterium]|nr:hypothetical protein [Alphaproteobacteria bacterium]